MNLGSARDPFGLVDQVLDEHFRIDSFVGEGGFSLVYKGLHLGLEEPIAIKCLKLPAVKGSALVESFVRRFREESRLHYRLSQGSLYITRTIASGTTLAPATGTLVPYMVLEWLEGRSLAADFEVRRAYGDKGRKINRLVELLDTAVDALAFAHSIGVAHRDVNPGNIFLAATRDGVRAKVLDFGVAKVINDEQLALGPRAPTLGAMRIFSPSYGAPEQFDSKIGPAGPWTDVYSLALILLEGMRDEPVRKGQNVQQLMDEALDRNHVPTPWNLGVDVPPEVEEVFVDALQFEPHLRFQDAGELWGRLKNALRNVRLDPPSTQRDIAPPSLTPPPVPVSLPPHLSHPNMPQKTQPIPQMPMYTPQSGVPAAQAQASAPAPNPSQPMQVSYRAPSQQAIAQAPLTEQPSHPTRHSMSHPMSQAGAPSHMPSQFPSQQTSQRASQPSPSQMPPPSSHQPVDSSELLAHSERGPTSPAFRVVIGIMCLALLGVVGVIAWQLWVRFN